MRLELLAPFLESLNGKAQSFTGERSRQPQTHRVLTDLVLREVVAAVAVVLLERGVERVRLEFGRIAVSETEAPNVSVNLVYSR
jgi:hypothetical protein